MAAIAHLLLRVGEVDTEYFRLQRCVHLFGSELRRTCRHRCERCCCANGMVATEPDWCSRIAKEVQKSELSAAITIQSAVRGHLVRKRLHTLR